MADSNQLLHFLTATTSNLQEALSKPGNAKKVNHRKYIQKRLQRSSKTAKKLVRPQANTNTSTTAAPVTMTTASSRVQPVATLPSKSSVCHWPLTNYEQYQLPATSSSSSTSLFSPSSLPYSRPPSRPDMYDQDFESLLYEIGLDSSPSQYSDTNVDPTNQRDPLSQPTSSTSTVTWESYVPSIDFIPSPPSDFSDFDDSAYSSPCNPSPVYYPAVSRSPPSCYQQHVATGSCEWLPSSTTCVTSTASLSSTASLMHITPTLAPSLTEILELVTP